MTANILAIGEALMRPASAGVPNPGRRPYVLKGALMGLLVGILARIWMRTISEDPVFTPVGTTLIFIVFSGLGALARLSLSWRRFGTMRRMSIVRSAAWAPFLLIGPFMLLFLPGLGLALLRTQTTWGKWLRRSIAWIAWALLVFFTLIFLGTDRGPGLVAAGLDLVVAWAVYFTNRIALTPPAAGHAPRIGPWERSKPNHAASGV